MTSSFFTDVIKTIDNEYASLADDGISAGDVSSFIDTGSYIFNALLSGSINGGLPSNKITALAGESSTGKTFFTLSIIKNFLETNKDAGVFYFESESAVSKQKKDGNVTESDGVLTLVTQSSEGGDSWQSM